jgi:hypothetical protein
LGWVGDESSILVAGNEAKKNKAKKSNEHGAHRCLLLVLRVAELKKIEGGFKCILLYTIINLYRYIAKRTTCFVLWVYSPGLR